MPRKATSATQTGSRKTTRVKQLQDSKKEEGQASPKADTKGVKRKAEDSDDKRPRKRAGKAKADLSMLPEMPIDILHEIFGHLEPYDLLRLARTSHALRNILMRPSSKDIWKNSFAGMEGFPPCPEDLVEPQYANLMFSYHCHDCGLEPSSDGPTLFMFMEARIQLCERCCTRRFRTWKYLPAEIPSTLKEFVPSTDLVFNKGWSGHNDKFYVDAAIALHNEYLALDDDENAKNTWFINQKARWAKISKHAELCEEYVLRQMKQESRKKREKSRQSDTIKQHRIREINQRFLELGYQEELAYMDGVHASMSLHPSYAQGTIRLRDHELVNQAKELTEKEWTKIKPNLFEFVEAARQDIVFRNRKALVEARIKKWVEPIYIKFMLSQPSDLPVPSLLEVCLIDEFRVPLDDTGDNEELSADTLEAGTSALPSFVDQWRNNKDEALLSIVRSSKAYSNVDASSINRDTLQLASTVFFCQDCEQGLQYPTLFSHACCLRMYYNPKPVPYFVKSTSSQKSNAGRSEAHSSAAVASKPVTPPKALILSSLNLRGYFSSRGLVFFTAAFHHLIALLDAHNLPHSTTRAELRKLDLFVILKCPCFRGYMQAPKLKHWTEVIDKKCRSHFEDEDDYSSSVLRKTSQYDAMVSKKQSERARLLYWEKVEFCCFACQSVYNKVGKKTVENHLVEAHHTARDLAKKYAQEFCDVRRQAHVPPNSRCTGY